MAEGIRKELAAAYTVSIDGVQRTRNDMAALDQAIKSLRTANYAPNTSTTVAASLGGKDLFVTKLDAMEGHIVGAVTQIMDEGMKHGKEYQVFALEAATTPTGRSGRGRNPGGRRGPGRDDTGEMIDSIDTNVEVLTRPGGRQITGWHGWGVENRLRRVRYQEKGTPTIQAANSLGHAIIPVREFLKRKLGELKK